MTFVKTTREEAGELSIMVVHFSQGWNLQSYYSDSVRGAASDCLCPNPSSTELLQNTFFIMFLTSVRSVRTHTSTPRSDLMNSTMHDARLRQVSLKRKKRCHLCWHCEGPNPAGPHMLADGFCYSLNPIKSALRYIAAAVFFCFFFPSICTLLFSGHHRSF